jgi:hypothetical protein
MKKYVIEREIPSIGSLTPEEYREAAAKSNQVLQQIGPEIQWVQSYVTADKMYCIYLAENEAAIERHAELSCFTATKITEVTNVIDPTTGSATVERKAIATPSYVPKGKLRIGALLSALLLTLVSSGMAQSRVKATIPFDFQVGTRTLHAGNYTIEPISSSTHALLALRDKTGQSSIIVNGFREERSQNSSDRPRLVFTKSNGDYLLSEIWLSAEDGTRLPKTRLHRELLLGAEQTVQVMLGK